MTEVTIHSSGEIALPAAVCRRYGMTPNSTIRLIETRSGVLLVPLTDEPMPSSLQDELREWQALATDRWSEFPYEDATQ